MIRFSAAQKPPIPMPFSPTRSRLDLLPQALVARTLADTAACLEQDSGFGGITLGEGLRQYKTLVKCDKSDVAFATVALPLLVAALTVMETVSLPLWLSASKRQEMLKQEGRHYPYEVARHMAVLPKEMLFNKLIEADSLYKLMIKHFPASTHQNSSREAFQVMVDRWVALGLVTQHPKMKDISLMITRKGRRALTQYTQTHPPGRGPS